jgi:mycofactocin precursor
LDKSECTQSAKLAGLQPSVESSEPQIVEEVIIEELSIDGICGVY